MDFDELKENLKDKFPIWASISSIVFGLASLFSNYKDYIPVMYISAFSLIGGGGLTFLIYYITSKNTLSKINPDYNLISTEDILEINDNDGRKASYSKKMKVKMKKDINTFFIFLPKNTGTSSDYQAYKCNSHTERGEKFNCNKIKYLNRDVLMIYHPFTKNEEVTFLFIWCLLDSFMEEEESIAVKAEPYQDICKLKVVTNNIRKSSWSMFYGENPKAYSEGDIIVQNLNGKNIVEHDFSPYLKKMHFRCSLSWYKN